MGELAESLRQSLEERKTRHPSYSLRAFARDLGLSHSHLSRLLKEQRNLALPRLWAISKRLNWPVDKTDRLVALAKQPERLRISKRPIERFRFVERDRFWLLQQWYYLPLLDLTFLSNFKATPQWIAQRLKLSQREVRAAVKKLTAAGFLKVDETSWKKVDEKLYFPAFPSKTLRAYHRKMIAKAIATLHSRSARELARRDITAITLPVDPQRLEAAKKKIQRFRRELALFLGQGNCTELYQLNVQLFPLTSIKSSAGAKPNEKKKKRSANLTK